MVKRDTTILGRQNGMTLSDRIFHIDLIYSLLFNKYFERILGRVNSRHYFGHSSNITYQRVHFFVKILC